MPPDYTTGYECERCKADPLAICDLTKLADVYYARLCVPCLNAWGRFMRAHAVWAALMATEAKASMLFAQTEHDGRDRTEELTEAGMQRNAVQSEIAAVAAQWITDGAA